MHAYASICENQLTVNNNKMGNCFRSKSKPSPLSILMLGVENTGKSEIGHVLAGTERIDFSPTKGTRMFNINVKGRAIKLMEIGGAETVRDLWPHYYNEAHGIIYVIDCSQNAQFELMYDLLHSLINHKNVRQKPLLIVANKQDLEDSFDLVDITYYFHIDELANLLGTPCYIATCGHNNHNDLFVGIEWLVDHIVTNFHSITNRIRFNRSTMSPVDRIRRQLTGIPRRRKGPNGRVRSAPSAVSAERATKTLKNTAKVAPAPINHFQQESEKPSPQQQFNVISIQHQ